MFFFLSHTCIIILFFVFTDCLWFSTRKLKTFHSTARDRFTLFCTRFLRPKLFGKQNFSKRWIFTPLDAARRLEITIISSIHARTLAVYILIPRVPGCVQSEMSPPCMHKQLIYSQTLASVMINFAWKAIEEAPKIFTRTAFGCSNLECGEIYSLLIRQCRRPRNNNAAVYLNHATVRDNLNANNGGRENYYPKIWMCANAG